MLVVLRLPNNIVIVSKNYPSFLTIKEGVFSKIIPSFFTIKEVMFESLRLPLAKGSSTFLTKPLFNGLYTPFGSPVCGGQKPQEREDVTALSAVFAPPVPPQREGPYPIPKP